MAKKSKRRPWSTADVRMLKTAARKKTRASSIARTLKRTEGATRQKAFSLGLSLEFASLRAVQLAQESEAPPLCGALILSASIHPDLVGSVRDLLSQRVPARPPGNALEFWWHTNSLKRCFGGPGFRWRGTSPLRTAMLDGSHYYKTFLDERPTLSSLQPPVLARLEAEFRRYFQSGGNDPAQTDPVGPRQDLAGS